jgi:DnaJ-domain-containing protein 1
MVILVYSILALVGLDILSELVYTQYKLPAKTIKKDKEELKKINAEIEQIKTYVKNRIRDSKDKDFVNQHIHKNINSILETTIFKRYNKYIKLEKIPTDVYQYVAIKQIEKAREREKEQERKFHEQRQRRQQNNQDYNTYKEYQNIFDKNTQRMFENFFRNFGYGNTNFNTTFKQKDYHKILGVDKSADFPTIKKAYRTLMKEYHPDKLQSLPEEDRLKSEEKSKEINEAYAHFQKTMK